MADFYSNETTGALDGTSPPSQMDGRIMGSKLRRIRATFTMASQASGSTLILGKRPAGSAFATVRMTVSDSTGSATIAVGVAGSTARDKAAAALTNTDTPTTYGKASALAAAPLTADETIIATTGGAALPSSGTLVFEYFYTVSA